MQTKREQCCSNMLLQWFERFLVSVWHEGSSCHGTLRASMTRSRASSSPSRMLKSISNSGLVKLSMFSLDCEDTRSKRRTSSVASRKITTWPVLHLFYSIGIQLQLREHVGTIQREQTVFQFPQTRHLDRRLIYLIQPTDLWAFCGYVVIILRGGNFVAQNQWNKKFKICLRRKKKPDCLLRVHFRGGLHSRTIQLNLKGEDVKNNNNTITKRYIDEFWGI